MKIYHSRKKESLWEKTKWFLKFSPAERYKRAVELGHFIMLARGKSRHDIGKSFKTVQILKQK